MRQIQEIRFQVLILLLLIVSGCGFQLRGAVDLPALYEKVYVVERGYSDIGKPLKKALQDAGSVMVNSASSATAVITLLSRGAKRRDLNVSAREIKEYELQLNIAFVVQDHTGKQLSEQQVVNVVRTFQNDENNVLGKDNEEQLIRQEMNQTAVIQILYRLKALAQ
jgi:LPS-assembly lipoprotein